ncbi:hypothetical protein ACFLYY_00700 [Patescibacteria group bacterium]
MRIRFSSSKTNRAANIHDVDFGEVTSDTYSSVDIGAVEWNAELATSTDYNEKINVDVSWDGGSSWSTATSTTLTGSETTYWYDVTSATSWTPTTLNDTNFKVRALGETVGTASDVYLDWLPVEVTYISASTTHTFYNYGISLAGNVIEKVEIGIEAYASSSEKVALEISANGGAGWSEFQTSTALSGSDPDATTWFDFTSYKSWDPTDLADGNLQARITYLDQGSQGKVYLDYIPVRITYSAAAPYTTQRAYTFENDDGITVNSNTTSTAANTTSTEVFKGERLIARFQLDNTGTDPITDSYKLQYDKDNDGNWTDVAAGGAPSSNSGATTSDWSVATVASEGTIGRDTSIAIGTDGYPVISYSSVNNCLQFAKCISGSCATASDWTTTTIDSSCFAGVGYTSIAIGTDNYPVISYWNDFTESDGELAFTKCISGNCTQPSDWTTTTVDSGYVGEYSSIAIGSDNYPIISYYDNTTFDLLFAKCAGDCTASSSWTTTTVDSEFAGEYSSIAIGDDGYPVISYLNSTSTSLQFAKCTTGDCTSAGNWTTTTIDNDGTVGWWTTIAIGTDGKPIVAYAKDVGVGSYNLYAAKCTSGDCTQSSHWATSTVDVGITPNGPGVNSSISIGTDGLPIISYSDIEAGLLKIAKCNDSACSGENEELLSIWDGTAVGSGYYSSITIAPDGYPIVSFYNNDTNDLMIAKMLPITEIQPSWGLSGTSSDALTTSTISTTCASSTSWTNGAWTEASGQSTSTSLGADECTEIAFALETSEAVASTTYRLRLVYSDDTELDNYEKYPALTIVSEDQNIKRYSKEAVLTGGSNGNYNTTTLDDMAGSFDAWPSIAIGTDGYPIVAYVNYASGSVKAAKCANANCTATTSVTTLDDMTDDNSSAHPSIAIGTDGYPIVVYGDEDNDLLKAVKCANANCTATTSISTLDNVSYPYPSIAIGTDGYPIVAYSDFGNGLIKVVKCANANCTATTSVTTLDNVSVASIPYSSIAIGTDGYPMVVYMDRDNGLLKAAKCANANCTATTSVTNLDDRGTTTNIYSSLAIGTDGYPIVTCSDGPNGLLKAIKCANANCTATTSVTNLDDTGTTTSFYSSLAIGTDGYPIVVYHSYQNALLKAVKCANANCTATTSISTLDYDMTGITNVYPSIAIGTDGYPIVAYSDFGNGSVKVVKQLGLPTIPIGYFNNYIGTDRQIKYTRNLWSGATTGALWLDNNPAMEDGLTYWFDKVDYTSATTDDTASSSISSTASASATTTPLFEFADNFDSTTTLAVSWTGQSTVAASTNKIYLQIFQFGSSSSTTGWFTIASTTSGCDGSDCTIQSDELDSDDYFFPVYNFNDSTGTTSPEYWVFSRIYQDPGASISLKTDYWNILEPNFVLTQRAYIFENDDGTDVNSNSTTSAANTTSTEIYKGQRITARFQLDNTGNTPKNSAYKLQYDKDNDSNWTDVAAGGAPSSNSGTNFGDWNSAKFSYGVSEDIGYENSIAVGTDGYPIITHRNTTATDTLMVTKCSSLDCSASSTQQISYGSDNAGIESSVAIGTDGYPVISHQGTDGVGSFFLLVTKCSSLDCSASSTQQISYGSNNIGEENSMVIGSDGYPVIAHRNNTSTDSLLITKCNSADCSASSTEEITYGTDDIGFNSSIAVGTDGYPIITHRNTTATDTLMVTKCSSLDCSASSTQQISYGSDNIGEENSMVIGSDGYPVIAHRNNTSTDSLLITKCNSADCSASSTEEITYGTDNIGGGTSIAIDTDGYPIIAHLEGTGSSGNLMVTKCSSLDCSASLTQKISYGSEGSGGHPSITIGTDGYPVIAHRGQDGASDFSLLVTKMLPITEIQPSWGLSGTSSDALTTSTISTTCASNTTWTNGVWTEASAQSISTSLGADECTEIAFALDTSEAVASTTYRLRLVYSDDTELDSYEKYPALTIVSEEQNIKRYSKEAILTQSDTASTSDWLETTLDSSSSDYHFIAIGTDGYPVIAYKDSGGVLKVTKCNNASCSSFSSTTLGTTLVNVNESIVMGTDGYPVIAYQGPDPYPLIIAKCADASCSSFSTTTLDDYGPYASLAIGTDGYPAVAYQGPIGNDLKFAKCLNSDCSSFSSTTLDDGWGQQISIAIGTDGYPVITYGTSTTYSNLRFIKCSDSSCTSFSSTTIDSSVLNSSLAIGTDGYPVISYYQSGGAKVAKCSDSSCTSFSSTTIDSCTSDLKIAIGTNGNPVISCGFSSLPTYLRLIDCLNSSCTSFSSTTINADGFSSSIAIGTDGYPVISFLKAGNNLNVVKQLGLPKTAISYFNNYINTDRQIKYTRNLWSGATTGALWLDNNPAMEDGLTYWFDKVDYTSATTDDTSSSSISSTASGSATTTPVFVFTDNFAATDTIKATWTGQSTVAASTNNIYLQIFRFGSSSSTTGWFTIASTTSGCDGSDCTIQSDTLDSDDYFFPVYNFNDSTGTTSPEYWVFSRVYQDGGTQDLKTDYWDISVYAGALINVSGTVYSDEGMSELLTGPTINLYVNNTFSASTTASTTDGSYAFSDAVVNAGSSITAYIYNNSATGTTVTVTDATTSITDLDIYKDHIIVRDDNTEAGLSIADMSKLDSDDDSAIRFNATTTGTDSLTIASPNILYVWPGSKGKFVPGGNIIVYNFKIASSTSIYMASGTETITIAGDWYTTSSANFVAASSTVVFTGTGSKTITTGGVEFYQTNFNNVAGTWTFQDNSTTTATTTLLAGTLSHGTDNDLIWGNMYFATNTTFTKASGTGKLYFEAPTDPIYIEDNSTTTANKQNLGNVYIGMSPAVTKQNSDIVVDSLTVNAGDQHDTRGYELDSTGDITIYGTLNTTDDKEADGTIITLGGDWLNSGGTFTEDNSTTTFSTSTSSHTITTDGDNFYNLVFEGGGGWSFVDSSTTTNNFTITSGTVTGTSTMRIGGNWSNSGTFNAASSTVKFEGATSSTSIISGATTFYNLTATTSYKTLQFATGTSATTTITGTLTLDGGDCSTTISLLSTQDGQYWYLNVTGTTSISYVDIKDSNAIGSAFEIPASNSNNSGNNVNWSINGGSCFATLITISGTVYTDEGTTTMASGTVVRIKINGAGDYSDETDGSGIYSVTEVTIGAAGDTITIFLDEATSTEKANLITMASSTDDDITNLDLYQNRIIVTHPTTTPLSIVNLAQYTNASDTDILFSATSSTGELTASSTSEFYVWDSKIFNNYGTAGVAGTVIFADFDNNGTTTASSTQTINVSGNWDNASGTFTAASSDIAFISNTDYALSFDGEDDYVAAGNDSSLISNNMTVETWFKVPDTSPVFEHPLVGRFNLNDTGHENSLMVDSNGNLRVKYRISSTDYSLSGGAVTTNVWHNAIFTFASGTQAIYLDGVEVASSSVVGYLESGTASDLLFGSGVGIGGDRLLYAEAIIDEVRIYNRALTNSETIEHYKGSFKNESGLVGLWHFDEGTGTSTADSSGNGNNGTLLPVSSEPTWTQDAAPKRISGNLNATSAFYDLSFNYNNGNWLILDTASTTNNLIATEGTVYGLAAMSVYGGNVTGGNGILNWSTSTFMVDGTGNFGGNSSWDFYNLNFGDDSGVTITTATGTATTNISNYLTIAQNQTLNAGFKTWNIDGYSTTSVPFIINGTFNASSSNFRYTSTQDTNITASTYYNLDLANNATSTLNLLVSLNTDDGWYATSYGFNFTNAEVISGNYSDAPAKTWMRWININGALENSIILNAHVETYTWNANSSTSLAIKARDVANATSPTSGVEFDAFTYTDASTTWNPTDATKQRYNSPDISAVIREIVPLNPSTILIAYLDNGSVASEYYDFWGHESDGDTAPRLYIEYISNPTYTLATTTGQALTVNNNLLIDNNVSVTANTHNPTIDVNGNVTISGTSTLIASTSAITVAGNWLNSGIFDAASSTVTFDATDSGNTISGNLNSTSSFHKIYFNGSGGDWTIQDPTQVTAPNAADTFLLKQGTVTLGDSANDDLEVLGKMVVGDGSGYATFTTAAINNASGTITININASTSPSSCTNCIVQVGTSTNSTSTFYLRKNAVLKFNSAASVESGLEVESMGYLWIEGEQIATNTVSSVSEDTSSTTITVSGTPYTADQFNGMHLRISSVASSTTAIGKIYDILDTTSNTINISATSTADYQIYSISTTTYGMATICASSTAVITYDEEYIGRYFQDKTGVTGYFKITNSDHSATVCGGSRDQFTLLNEPDSDILTTFAVNDTFNITDFINTGDEFEVLDYAKVTADTTNNGYIYAGTSSETLIRYADIDELGADTANKYGISFNSVNGSNSNEGIIIDKSRIRYGHHAVYANNTSNNNSDNSKGFTSNYIYGSSDDDFHLEYSYDDDIISNQIDWATNYSVYLKYSSNNTISSNIFFWSRPYLYSSSNTVVTLNEWYGSFGMRAWDSHNNTITFNKGYSGFSFFDTDTCSNNTIAFNSGYSNSSLGIYLWNNSNNNTVVSNNMYESGIGIGLQEDTYDNVIVSNQLFGNDYGMFIEATTTATIINHVSGYNTDADIGFWQSVVGPGKISCYNCQLNSATEVLNATTTEAYFVSFKHDGISTSTQIWGEYAIPTDDSETPQDESTVNFNYASSTWEDSIVKVHFNDSGAASTKDTDLSFDFGTGFATSAASYRVTYNGTYWTVYRDENNIGTTTSGTEFDDSTSSLKFTIQEGGSVYTTNDTYTFVAFVGSDNADEQKYLNMMQNGDIFTVPYNTTLEMIGTSTATTTISRDPATSTGGYHFDIEGTINANYYEFNYLGGTDDIYSTLGNTGLYLTASATVISIDYGWFDNFASTTATDTYITIHTDLIGATTTEQITGVYFGNTGSTADYNVSATGTGVAGYWKFISWSGDFGGENYDFDVSAPPGEIQWQPLITISGTVYTDEGTTTIGSARVVRVKVNGEGDYSADTNGSGIYSVSNVTIDSVGDTITIFLDEATSTEKANLVTMASSTSEDITDLDLYQDRIIVTHPTSTPLSIVNLAQYTNASDTDILFSATSSTGELTASSTASTTYEFYVWDDKTFNNYGTAGAAGTISLEDFDNNGTTTASSTQTINISGNWDNSSGTFVAASSDLTFINNDNDYALNFDGDNDYVSVASSTNLNITGPITLEGWVKFDTLPSDPDYTTLVGREGGSPRNGYILIFDGTSKDFYFQLFNSDAQTSIDYNYSDWQEDTWYHVAFTYDDVNVGKAYLNGALNKTLPSLGADKAGSNVDGEFWMGKRPVSGGIYFDGILDEVRIYDRVLSDTEITEHYKKSFKDDSGLVGNWRFKEGSGTSTYDGSDTGNNGTLLPASSEPTWSTTTSPKSIWGNNDSPFYDLTFNGSGCTWIFQDDATTTNDLTVTDGTASSLYNMNIYGGDVTGNGNLSWSSSTFMLDGAGSFGGTSEWTFYNLTFGDGSGNSTTTAGSTGTTTVTNYLTIAANQELNAGTKTWNIAGASTTSVPFVINGIFNASSSTFRYIADEDTNITADTYYNLNLDYDYATSQIEIDMGAIATDTGALLSGYTNINMVNPANATGKITSVEIRGFVPMTGVKVGTFYGSEPDFIPRDYAVIGNVASGTIETFSGLDIDVVAGDYIGIYNTTGNIYDAVVGGSGVYRLSGDQFDSGEQTYTIVSGHDDDMWLYGIGAIGANYTIATTTGQTLTVDNNLSIGDGVSPLRVTANTNNPIIDVNGNVIINGTSTFIASSSDITVADDWLNSGTFTAASSTVKFDGATSSTSTISGATTFYNLTATTSYKVLEFATGTSATTTVEGILTLDGGDCDTMITLLSNQDGQYWYLNVLGTTSISYVDVKDSNATGSAFEIPASNSNNSENNVNWSIDGGTCFGITISGTAYTDEGTTTIGSARVVRVKVNGEGDYSADTNGSGIYSVSNVTIDSVGDTITIFLDEATSTEKANLVTMASSTSEDITDLDLYQDRIIVTHPTSTPLSIVNLAQYTNASDTDILFSATSSTGELTASSTSEFYVWDSKTYNNWGSANGTTTFADFDNNGTTTASSTQTINISGSWDNASGTFNAASSTVTFTSTATGKTILGNLNATSSFYKLYFNGDGGSWTIQDPIQVTAPNAVDTFLVKQGTVTLGDSANDDLEVLGAMIVGDGSGYATFTTAAINNASGTITININASTTPIDCVNCKVWVASSTANATSTFYLRKNTILKFNSFSDTQSGLEVESMGYLWIEGEQTATNTISSVSEDISSTTITVSGTPYTADQFNGMHLRISSVASSTTAIGKIYDILDTTSNTINISATTTPDYTIFSISTTTYGVTTICANSTGVITTDQQYVGKYFHDKTGTTGYFKIFYSDNAASACGSSRDQFKVIAEPDSDILTTFAVSDTFNITDFINTNDEFEILDYAQVMAATNTHGYIYAKQDSETLIRYADISENGTNTTNKYGITFVSVNGNDSNEGVTIDKSRIRNGYRGIYTDTSSRNNGSKGFSNNSIYSNSHYGIYLASDSNYNNVISNNTYNNNNSGIFIDSQYNAINLNNSYNNTGSGSGIRIESSRNTYTLNNFYGNAGHGLYSNSASRETFTSNNFYGNINSGISDGTMGLYSSRFISNNIYGNKEAVYIGDGQNNIFALNNFYVDRIDFYGYNNTLTSNNFYGSNGTALTLAMFYYGVFESNNIYNNGSYGMSLSGVGAAGIPLIIVNNTYSTNTTADIDINNSWDNRAICYNCNLNSSTQLSNITKTDSYFASFNHNDLSTSTQIWGEYEIPTDDTETPQDESNVNFNYASSTWPDSIARVNYTGLGSKDTDLNFNFGGGFGTSSATYWAVCTTTNVSWYVYRNGTYIGNATTGETFTDSTYNLSFQIDDVGTNYATSDMYTFVAFAGSDNADEQKNLTMMQDGDMFTVPTSTTLEIRGGGSSASDITNINYSTSTGSWFLYNNTSSELLIQEAIINNIQFAQGTTTVLNTILNNESVTSTGALNTDWYLGVHVVAIDSTSTNIVNATCTISEASGSSTVCKYNSGWGTGDSSQDSTTSASGITAQPNSDGALRIREYQRTAGATTTYNYNLAIASTDGFVAYNYYNDYGNNYLQSTSTGSGDNTIYEGWQRNIISSVNGTKDYSGLNESPEQGTWYAGMTSDLQFTINLGEVNLTLGPSNNWTSEGTSTLYATTSYGGGYTIRTYALNDGKLATSSYEIARWPYSNSTPSQWDTDCADNGSYCGFGYTTSDSNLAEGTTTDRFTNPLSWAGFATSSGATDPVADSSGPVSGATTTITYKVSVSADQSSGAYEGIIYYIATVNY